MAEGRPAFPIAEKRSKLRAMKYKQDRCCAEYWECFKASLHPKVERPIRMIKQFGFTSVRYGGLARKAAKVQSF